MKNCVFIHTNERQWLGALVSEYSLRRNSRAPDSFDVRILHTRDFPYLREQEGKSFLRGGTQRIWRMDDLQSFTPLRFQPPQQMHITNISIRNCKQTPTAPAPCWIDLT